MGTWYEYLKSTGTPPQWPYPVKFGEEREEEADVLVLGGGIARSFPLFRESMWDTLREKYPYAKTLADLRILAMPEDEVAIVGAASL